MASANSTRMSAQNQVTRRAVLAAAPSAALLTALQAGDVNAAVTAPASAAQETPVAALFRQWRTQNSIVNATETDDDCSAESAVRTEIETLMFAEPARNERDICLKLLALSLDGADFMDDTQGSGRRIMQEARALVGVAT